MKFQQLRVPRFFFVFAYLVLSPLLGPSNAATMIQSVPEPHDWACGNPLYVIVHAEILGRSAAVTSGARPAHGKIRILKTLRGRNTTVPREVEAIFLAPYGQKDTQEYPVPPEGSQVILFYCCLDSGRSADENVVHALTTLCGFSLGSMDTRGMLTWAAAACFIGSFLLYAFYESGIPVEINIRIDILFIVPVLFVNLLGLGWLGLRTSRKRGW
jgi:hypothetical protein